MISDPTGKAMGMDAMLPYFQILPFADVLYQDFLFPGFALLFINGIPNLIAAAFLFAKKKTGVILGTIFGVTLMAWIVIQFVIFPPNFMSSIYFIFGGLQFLTGVVCLVGYNQSKFTFSAEDYKNIGSDKKKLVVYFSRMGYTKKIAYGLADETGAELYEIKATERTEGNLGFWWSGRFAMHRMPMPIETPQIDLSAYEEVTVCSPVWVFGIASPVLAFCDFAKGKISSVNYALVHFMNAKFEKLSADLDSRLGIKHKKFFSFRSRFGKIKLL